MSKWIELSNDEIDVVLANAPKWAKTVIRDDDAAMVGANAWLATDLPCDEAEAEYQSNDGTVSAVYTINA